MVPLTSFRSKAARCLPVVLAALFFAGCGTQKSADQPAAHLEGSAQADSNYYLQQMQQSSDDSKTTWQLLAIRALLKEGQSQKAQELFGQLPQNLSETQRQEQALLAVELKLAQNDPAAAKALLAKLDAASVRKDQQARYWQDVIAAEQGKPSLTLLRALIAQQPLLTAEQDKQKNIDATWQALASMSKEQAAALVINADENVLQGWLDLQRVWFDSRGDAEMLKAGIKDWQTRYPQNPAAKMLPSQLANVQNFKPASTSKIALLLPLNGQAAVFGRTIQQGFEAAKNGGAGAISGSAVPEQSAQAANVDDTGVASPAAAGTDDLTQQPQAAGTQANPVRAPGSEQDGETVPTPAADQPQDSAADSTANSAAPEPQSAAPVPYSVPPAAEPASTAASAPAPAPSSVELKVYDTTSAPLSQLLTQAQQDGASLVVGPLLKNDVDGVVKSNTPLNVLALNQPESVENRANICYFALSPEDEARDAARHIHEQGKQAPLLLIPRSALGDRVANAFAQEWQSLGGGVVLQQKFGSLSELRGGVNGGGGIALTGTPVAASQPQSVTLGDLTIPAPADTQPASGGSVDAAYIVATPDEIAYIKPMISMRNGSRSGATLYASSRSAQGTAGPDFRLEMDGLQYSEIPMLAGSNPSLMRQALSAVHNDYSLARLYAMGADAWTLANHFSQMRQMSGYELRGNTGDLSANQDCVINRKLSWLKYQQGQIVPAS
ncbi:penicillin-binding protein activator [Pluralibacter gergoviae]|nr:penicillin-binding protein activator [Pluralibacter gergoviae]EKZ9513664.1 penicillin-binding protein activator [Pluralibacter gergoviae]ELC3015760.1 penicillin-binding protein activator [Pluralibacter gergoviae]ELC3020739.1 penicillin-binding protein activator [Pluralibacter gergoviae]